MKKGTILFLLTFFLIFCGTSLVFAFGPTRSPLGSAKAMFYTPIFGGKIVAPKALEITELEDFGYTCMVPGTSIEISPIGSPVGTPTSYFIPAYIISKTRTTPRAGQFILGKYFGKTTIECIQQADGVEDIQTVVLDTIILFGTSR